MHALTVIDHVLRTFIGHVMSRTHASLTVNSHMMRTSKPPPPGHAIRTSARTQAHASLTVNDHVTRTSTRARTHMQRHKHTRTHTYARTQAHAHASLSQWSRDAHKHTRTHSLTFIGHVTRTQADAHAKAHAHALSLTVNGHVTRTRTRAHTHIHRSRYAPARTHHSPPAARTHMQTSKNMNSDNPRSADAHKHTRTHCLAHAHSMVQKPTFTTSAAGRTSKLKSND